MKAESSSAVSSTTTRTGAPGTSTSPVAAVTVTLGTGSGLGVSVPSGRSGTAGKTGRSVQPASRTAPSPARAVRRES
ncbi:hypothetical protein ACFQ0T_17715 [Kitasatospora gansuensis]